MPWLILFKILLACIPALVIVPPIAFFVTCAYLPLDLWRTYSAALITPRLGIEFKMGLAMTMFIPALLFPIGVLLLSPFYAIGAGGFVVACPG